MGDIREETDCDCDICKAMRGVGNRLDKLKALYKYRDGLMASLDSLNEPGTVITLSARDLTFEIFEDEDGDFCDTFNMLIPCFEHVASSQIEEVEARIISLGGTVNNSSLDGEGVEGHC